MRVAGCPAGHGVGDGHERATELDHDDERDRVELVLELHHAELDAEDRPESPPSPRG